MPHKHVRRGGDSTGKDFDLAPHVRAQPLAPGKTTTTSEKTKSKKRKRKEDEDDTPREFKRLLQMQAHMSNKGRKVARAPQDATAPAIPTTKKKASTSARQRPDDAANVAANAADSETIFKEPKQRRPLGLDDPLTSTRATTADIPVLKNKPTRLQKKISKKVSAWRVEDERLRKQRAEEAAKRREEEEERIAAMLDSTGVGSGVLDEPGMGKEFGLEDCGHDDEDEQPAEMAVGESRRRKRRAKEKDDWEVLKGKRTERRGLHDVVQAPPELRKVREVFKVRSGATDRAGNQGLKAKADLSEARLEVIRRYREMMGGKRGL